MWNPGNRGSRCQPPRNHKLTGSSAVYEGWEGVYRSAYHTKFVSFAGGLAECSHCFGCGVGGSVGGSVVVVLEKRKFERDGGGMEFSARDAWIL